MTSVGSGPRRASRCRRALVLSLAACALSAGLAARSRADVIERVVAVVNDDAIFLSDLRTKAAPFLERATRLPTERQRQAAIRTVYEQVLEVLINQRLILQAAEEDDITVSSADVDEALATMRREAGLGEEDFWAAVADQGFVSREAFRRNIREQLLQYRVINARVRSRVNITEDDVRARYAEMVAQARRSARFTAADIVVPFGASPTATELAAARRRAEAIRAEITDVDDFEDAMEAHRGFELGTLDEGDLEPDLEAALAALEEGAVSPAVRGSRAFHILLLRRRELGSAEVDPYEEVWQDIYREMLEDAMERQQELFIDELRRAATIDRRLD